MFPLPHAEALATEIPNAHLIPLPGVGHQQPPPELWDLTLTALVDHTDQV
jgi:hypothetical protein